MQSSKPIRQITFKIVQRYTPGRSNLGHFAWKKHLPTVKCYCTGQWSARGIPILSSRIRERSTPQSYFLWGLLMHSCCDQRFRWIARSSTILNPRLIKMAIQFPPSIKVPSERQRQRTNDWQHGRDGLRQNRKRRHNQNRKLGPVSISTRTKSFHVENKRHGELVNSL